MGVGGGGGRLGGGVAGARRDHPGGSVEAEVGAASGECVVTRETEHREMRRGLKRRMIDLALYFTGPQISWEVSHIAKCCGKW